MTTLYAQSSAEADVALWNTLAAGGGDTVDWMDHLETDILEANGRTIGLNAIPVFTRDAIKTLNGGGWTVNLDVGGSREFTCNLVAGTTPCLTISGATYPLTIAGSTTGGTSSGAHGFAGTSAAQVTVTGDITGGPQAAYGGYLANGSGKVTCFGTCRGGESHSSVGLNAFCNCDVMHCVGAAGYRGPGLYSPSQYYTRIVRGVVDFTANGPPIGGFVPRFARTVVFKVFDTDGVTPIYFRPYRGRGILTGGAI